MRAPLAGRPTHELAGDRPKRRRAATPQLDRPPLYFFFNFERVFCLCIAFEGDLSEVAYAVGGTSQAELDFLRYAHVVSEIPVAPPREGARKTCVERGGLLLTFVVPVPVLPVHGPVLTQSFSGHISARALRSWCSSCTAPDLSADFSKGEGRSPMWTSGESVCATVQCCGQTASGESRSWTSSLHPHTLFRLQTNSPVPGPVLALLSPGQALTILSPHVHVRRTLRSWCSSCMAPDLSAGLFKWDGSLPMWTSGERVCAAGSGVDRL